MAIRERCGVTAAAPRRIASPRPGECGGFAPATRRHLQSRPEHPAREDVAWIVHPQVHPRVCDTGSERQQHRARLGRLPRGRDRKRERRRRVAGGETTTCGACAEADAVGRDAVGPASSSWARYRRRCDSEREEAAVCRTLAAGPPANNANAPARATHSTERSAEPGQHHEQTVDRRRQRARHAERQPALGSARDAMASCGRPGNGHAHRSRRSRTCTPGSGRPSRNSSTSRRTPRQRRGSRDPAIRSAAASRPSPRRRSRTSPMSKRRRRRSRGCRRCTARELEPAHRAVPEHRCRRSDQPGVANCAVGADVEPHPAVGYLDAIHVARSGTPSCPHLATRRSVGSSSRQPDPRAVASTARAGSTSSLRQSE